MAPKTKFSDGEKVLTYHGPLIYEAKVVQTQIQKDKQVKYFIHYAGWNKNWDEWILEGRILKYNDVNVQLQRETMQNHNADKGASKNKKAAPKTPVGKTDKPAPVVKESDSRPSTPTNKDLLAKDVPTTSSRSRGGSKCSNSSVTPATSKDKDTVKPAEDGVSEVKKRRIRLDTENQSLHEEEPKNEIKITIPEELKPLLVDDWDAINRQHKLVDLPAKMTVELIIDNYMAYKKTAKSSSTSKETSVSDISNGILEYFNVMLGSQLLYKIERSQYAEILREHPNKRMSEIYGSFHLLRLFVKLGSVLTFTTLNRESIDVLIGHLQDFLKYLAKNISTLFQMKEFVHASSEYQRISVQ